jgi:YbgC/YbaW family acyl-CoA thioester hydrolase
MQFIYQKRIYGFECDIYGHLNNANYLTILEAARSEALQEMGMPIQKLLNMKWHMYVLRFEMDYIRALQLEDMVEVRSKVMTLTKVKSSWQQEIYNSNGELCFRAIPTVVFAYNGKPARLVPEIMAVFEKYLEKD